MMWITKFMDSDKIVDIRETNKMCRYKSRKEIEDMMKCGKIMSGFCAGDDGKNMCIAYGKRKKRVNCVVLRHTGDRDNMIKECGMVYVEWKLRKKEVMGVMYDETLFNSIKNYWLLMPYVEKDKPFCKKYAIILMIGTRLMNWGRNLCQNCAKLFLVGETREEWCDHMGRRLDLGRVI